MTKDEALKLAIEAIENADYHNDLQAIAVIKEIMAQPEQEPVAWLCRRKTGGSLFVYTEEQLHELGYGNISVPPFDKVSPLYTTPPQTEEKLITTVDIEKIVKFKERNT